ncbi:hypothetical protein [uncultured Paraglaciecola sp.]|uniref:hypothetical protein n=1 Tax=uncultured Paraglaciecola sp. TaxID=1765024 RepID=UPI0026229AE4|nr:hypothetical protein [uncultured Paraglaciecola sp.]
MNKILQFYGKYWLVRCIWWLGIVIPSIPFILVSLGLLLLMHWPKNYQDVVNIDVNLDAEYLTFSAHGVKDSAASWSDELQLVYEQIQPLTSSDIHTQHISFGWQPYSDSVFNCSVDGKKIGYAVGEKVAQLPNLNAVHLVGHSCGSFVIYGMCTALKEIRPAMRVHTTYLDPVSVYSGVFWDYGIEYFGSCADFSDAYIDTQDTVPGSNQALHHGVTFDVTQTRISNHLDFAPHAWPTLFYVNALKKQQVPIHYNSFDVMGVTYQKNTLNKWTLSY